MNIREKDVFSCMVIQYFFFVVELRKTYIVWSKYKLMSDLGIVAT